MKADIERLIRMGDVEAPDQNALEDDDWRTPMDAAEGLVKPRERRGIDYLTLTVESEDAAIGDAAAELPEGPDAKSLLAEIEAQEVSAQDARVREAKMCLHQGHKVFGTR